MPTTLPAEGPAPGGFGDVTGAAVSVEPAPAERPTARRRRLAVLVAVAALALLSFASSMVVQRHWFPHLSKDNDEPVYLYQADLFRQGNLTLPAESVDKGLRPWMSGTVGDRVIMVFPPGWPAVIAVGMAMLGSWRLVAALVAAAVVVAVYAFSAELLRDRWSGLMAAALVAVSPMAMVLTGTILSYPFALAVDAVLGLFALRAVRLDRPRQLVVVGLCAGVLFATRPLDSLIMAGVFGGYLLWSWRRRWAHLWQGGAWAAAGSSPVVAAVLFYNSRVTGHPLRFPLHANGGNNQFGFGRRWITLDAPVFEVTPALMTKATVHLLATLPDWVAGSYLAFPLALFGLALIWRKRPALAVLLVVLGAAYPVAHFFYWGTYFVAVGVDEYGPFYYLPMLLPLAVAGGAALRHLLRAWRPLGVALGVALAGISLGLLLPPKLASARAHTTAVAREVALAGQLPPSSVLILPASQDGPWVMHVRGYFRNRADLTNPVVYASDDGRGNFTLFDRFPDRRVFSLYGVVPESQPHGRPIPRIERLERVRAQVVDVDAQFVNRTRNPTVVSYLGTPEGMVRCVLDEESKQGARYRAHWEVRDGSVTPPPGCVPLPLLPFADAMNGYLAAGFTAAGNTDVDGGVNRWEHFYAMRSGVAGVEVLTPGIQRRAIAGDQGEPRGLFPGQVERVLQVDVTARPATEV